MKRYLLPTFLLSVPALLQAQVPFNNINVETSNRVQYVNAITTNKVQNSHVNDGNWGFNQSRSWTSGATRQAQTPSGNRGALPTNVRNTERVQRQVSDNNTNENENPVQQQRWANPVNGTNNINEGFQNQTLVVQTHSRGNTGNVRRSNNAVSVNLLTNGGTKNDHVEQQNNRNVQASVVNIIPAIQAPQLNVNLDLQLDINLDVEINKVQINPLDIQVEMPPINMPSITLAKPEINLGRTKTAKTKFREFKPISISFSPSSESSDEAEISEAKKTKHAYYSQQNKNYTMKKIKIWCKKNLKFVKKIRFSVSCPNF